MRNKQKKQTGKAYPSGFGKALQKDLKKNAFAYWLLVPVLLWYIVFCYAPMWGVLLAFKDYKPLLGFGKSVV